MAKIVMLLPLHSKFIPRSRVENHWNKSTIIAHANLGYRLSSMAKKTRCSHLEWKSIGVGE